MRRPGQHARTKSRQLAWRALAYLTAIIAAGIAGGVVFGIHAWAFVALELILIALMVAIDQRALPAIDCWHQGAVGEETVGRLLSRLTADGWRVLHDVQTGRGNIDHVVFGPGRLFTIETKSHGGRVAVGRIDEHMLKQAYAQRKWVERATGERAEALLVFSRAYLDRPISRRRGVLVLTARMLCEHLRRRPQAVLSAERARGLEQRLQAATA